MQRADRQSESVQDSSQESTVQDLQVQRQILVFTPESKGIKSSFKENIGRADRMSSFGDFISLSDVCDVATAKLIQLKYQMVSLHRDMKMRHLKS